MRVWAVTLALMVASNAAGAEFFRGTSYTIAAATLRGQRYAWAW
jgi:hypothetical protein